MSTSAEIFEVHRTYLFGIAYRMLGSAMEAEDMVQEAYLRFRALDSATIESHRAFLCTITTRLCLDHLKSAKVQRESYFGTWLPEPIRTDTSPAQIVGERDSLSIAFLVLLESLTPVERAVFLLREVFDYGYDEIARIVEREPTTCRQIFSRAKKHITANRPRFKSDESTHATLFSRFMTAIEAGELNGLTQMLAKDATLWSDGGGKRSAATRPVSGADRVARFLIGIRTKMPDGFRADFAEVNGTIGLLIYDDKNRVYGTLMIDVSDGTIHAVRMVVNPDKLTMLH